MSLPYFDPNPNPAPPEAGTDSGGGPAYMRLANILRERIMSGEYATFGRLPTQQELAADFDVSAATVSKAIRILTGEGMVLPGRSRGARLRERGEHVHVREVLGSKVAARAATSEDARRYLVPEGAVILVVSGGGRPDRVYPADEVTVEFTDDVWWNKRH